jgi:hypothetical protein
VLALGVMTHVFVVPLTLWDLTTVAPIAIVAAAAAPVVPGGGRAATQLAGGAFVAMSGGIMLMVGSLANLLPARERVMAPPPAPAASPGRAPAARTAHRACAPRGPT